MSNKLVTKKEESFVVFKDEVFAETIANLVSKIEIAAASSGTSWMEDLTIYTGQVNNMGQKTQLMEDAILSTMKRLWQEEKIKPEITSMWEGNFWNWAKFVCQRGVEVPSDVTLQNRISVYDFYFTYQNQEGGFCLPPTLTYEIEIEDAEGQTIIEEVVIENPNLYTAAYGKLLAAKGWAVKQGGNLTDKTIAYMVSPRVTNQEFKKQLRAEKDEIEGTVVDALKDNSSVTPPIESISEDVEVEDYITDIDTYEQADIPINEEVPLPSIDMTSLETPQNQGVFGKEGDLYFHQDGITVPAYIQATPQDGADHPLVSVGQRYIQSRFGIQSEPVDIPEPTEAPIFALVGDDVILSVNGYTFAVLSPEEAVTLFDEMSENIEAITEKTGYSVD
jgi:hypothetical protein